MKPLVIHPLWIRCTHWCNALAVIAMALSGWQIYNASPIFGQWAFPEQLTLGGWLGGAIQWHFAFMWLLVINFLIYVVMNILTGRFARKLWPLNPKALLSDAWAALRGRLGHADLSHYNAVQKFAYAAVVVDIFILIVSGLAIWKPVQLSPLAALVGGFDNGRIVHFFAMAFLVLFFIVHVLMVALVPRSLMTMLRGR
jgi:thiosulfate reductase cytochrome b subunit